MSMRIKVTVLLICITGFCISQDFSLRSFSKDQGLPDSYVYSVLQDSAGFLWISTGDGLVIFDGQFFRNVPVKIQGDDILYSSAIDKNGTLWFGSASGKLYSGNQHTKEIKIFAGDCKASVKKLTGSRYTDKLFISTVGNGIFIKEGEKLIHIKGTEDYQVNAIEEFNAENLLACTSEGLFLIDLGTEAIAPVNGLTGEIYGIRKLKKTNCFLISSANGFEEIELNAPGKKLTRRPFKTLPLPVEGPKEFVYKEAGEDLFISVNETLMVLNTLNGKVYTVDKKEFSAAANSLFVDNESNLWITTIGKGLYRLSKEDYELNDPGGSVNAITQDRTGTIYYGTNNGISVKNKSGISSVLKIGKNDLGKINALYFDGLSLWIGTDHKGLFVVDPANLKERKIEFSDIKNMAINSVSGNGSEVQVTTNLEGVYNYKDYLLQDHFSVKNSLLHNNVYASLKSKTGKIYYATHNTSFNYSHGHQLYEIDVKPLGLTSDFNYFAEDKNGNIAIATNGEGVYMLKDTTIRPFALNHKLDSKFIQSLLYDKNGDLWIVQRYNLYKYYTKEQVLTEVKTPASEEVLFNPKALFMADNGDLYFGTNMQVITFAKEKNSSGRPVPYLVSTTLSDSLVDFRKESFLSNGIYDLKIEYSALGLKNSEAIRFSYKLEGRDNNWSEPTAARNVEYPKLNEGNYVFRLRAYNSKGFASEETTLFYFTIDVPFWKKPLSWIIALTLVAGLFFLLVKARTSALIKAKNKLEEIVTEKTKELRKEKELVEKNNILIEEQNHEIRDSITYAKRIQDALLPDKAILEEYHKNLFVLYQPRDIVSGDFYWIGEVNGLKIVVAADCTGHGVPGALMSMIGTTLLNKIVVEKKFSRPKEILKELDKEIKQALKQRTEDATRDGMDVCLCCIDVPNKKIIYAGALRPMFYVRDHQLTECIPTKHAIGGFSYGKEKEFEETEIDMKKGDMYYLFSDGYADQFGGEKGKKLMVKNFKKILVSIAEMELPKQEENLKRVYNNWKGDLDQVDDVLVMGIKI